MPTTTTTTLTTTVNPQDYNNPTKEILASSGIYNGTVMSNKLFADDIPRTGIANTGINTTTTTTTTAAGTTLQPFPPLSSGNYFIDDMLIFNNFIYHDSDLLGGVKQFNPRLFLEQANVTFNAYSLEYRS